MSCGFKFKDDDSLLLFPDLDKVQLWLMQTLTTNTKDLEDLELMLPTLELKLSNHKDR
jgi:hypothetical protein